MNTENNTIMEIKQEIKNTKRIQISYKLKVRVLSILVIILTIVSAISVSDMVSVSNIEKRQRATILRERNYLIGEYDNAKSEMRDRIIVITTILQDNTDLIFSSRDKKKMMEAYSVLVDMSLDIGAVDKITEMNELNLDLYVATIMINDDLRGFVTNFAVAIQDRNYTALDNSMRYLNNMIKIMDDIEKDIPNYEFKR